MAAGAGYAMIVILAQKALSTTRKRTYISNKNVKEHSRKSTHEKSSEKYLVKAIYKEIFMTQCDFVLKYIEDFGSISALEAFRDLGIMRLAARISDLESRGYRFNRKQERFTNRYGKKGSYTRYSKAA